MSSSPASADLALFWNPNWTFGDILHHLAQLAPDDVKAIQVMAEDQLRHRLRQHHDAMLKDWLRN